MLSAIVFCEPLAPLRADAVSPPEILVRTLAALVAPAVAGLVRDVVIVGGNAYEPGIVAEHAGCAFIVAESLEAGLAEALLKARLPSVLVLRVGCVPPSEFIDEAGDLLRADPQAAALLRARPERFAERIIPRLAPLAGLIAPRRICLDAPAGALRSLARHVHPRQTLRSRARRIG
jgi:hypothetical protein